jgi:AraC-like DNA-binding protein
MAPYVSSSDDAGGALANGSQPSHLPSFAPGIGYQHFDSRTETRQQQTLAWRGLVEHIVDVPVSWDQVQDGFVGVNDSYRVDDFIFTDSFTAPVIMQRPIARISTDNLRHYVFSILIEGGIGDMSCLHRSPCNEPTRLGIAAIDLNQPMRIDRPASRLLTLFAPRGLVESNFPEAESIHGRFLDSGLPLTQLTMNHLWAVSRDMQTMSASEVSQALCVGTHLIVAGFSKQARMGGSARAAVRAATFGQVRRYIKSNLRHPELSPTSVLQALRLPRLTVYRMFEHEGGLGTYIRHCRLREATNELVRQPQRTVRDIAYGLGFKSASDFNHAFRRAFDLAPQDLRALGKQPRQPATQKGRLE